MEDIKELYLSGLSLSDISKKINVHTSTVRYRLLKNGVKLRSRLEGISLAAQQGKMSTLKGTTRVFTEEWKRNISTGKIKAYDKTSTGKCLKPSGYIEITRGVNKGRSEHVVIIEKLIGRRLYSNECVHHKDGVRHNNDIENLELMTRREHLQYHRSLDTHKRNRDIKGRFL